MRVLVISDLVCVFKRFSIAFAIVLPQVDRALAERGQHLGLSGPTDGGAADEESAAKLNEMKEEMEVTTWLMYVL